MIQTKLTGETQEIIKDNISKLKEIFPDIISEDKIDFDKLKLILGENIEDNNERYAFDWPGKNDAIKESQKTTTGTLRPCKEESKNWDTTENLYIEGDNLEVLKILQKSYNNQIKAIYIDPPYNTGKDFIYSDNYADNLENYLEQTGQISGEFANNVKLTNNPETTGRFHSNWLNMMYPRLKLARNLLTDDGVIFISIDDNEEYNLKKICDEIFGEKNFVTNFIWQSTAGSNTGTDIITVTENILVYAKNKTKITFDGNLVDESSYKNVDEYYDKRGKFALDKLDSKRQSSHYSEALNYPIIMPDDSIRYPGGTSKKNNDGWNYLWSKNKVEWGIKNGFIQFKKKNDGWTVYNKRYYKVDNNDNPIERTIPFRNMIFSNQFTTANGTKEVKELFDANVFDYPKPSLFIKYLLNTCLRNDKSATVLDFFSGSASTAHAIIDFNNGDGGNRKFILVQIPEATDEDSIAYRNGYYNLSEIGKERIRRAGDKILEESDNKDLDIGFKVFKLDSSNLEKWNPDYDDIQQSLIVDNIKAGRTNEDLIYEIMLKTGLDLTAPIKEIDGMYVIQNSLLICLEDNITKQTQDKITNLLSDGYRIRRVVLKDSGFKTDADKTNIMETLKVNKIDEFITI